MKKNIFLFFLCFFAFSAIAQEKDSINTNHEISLNVGVFNWEDLLLGSILGEEYSIQVPLLEMRYNFLIPNAKYEIGTRGSIMHYSKKGSALFSTDKEIYNHRIFALTLSVKKTLAETDVLQLYAFGNLGIRWGKVETKLADDHKVINNKKNRYLLPESGFGIKIFLERDKNWSVNAEVGATQSVLNFGVGYNF